MSQATFFYLFKCRLLKTFQLTPYHLPWPQLLLASDTDYRLNCIVKIQQPFTAAV